MCIILCIIIIVERANENVHYPRYHLPGKCLEVSVLRVKILRSPFRGSHLNNFYNT